MQTSKPHLSKSYISLSSTGVFGYSQKNGKIRWEKAYDNCSQIVGGLLILNQLVRTYDDIEHGALLNEAKNRVHMTKNENIKDN